MLLPEGNENDGIDLNKDNEDEVDDGKAGMDAEEAADEGVRPEFRFV